MVNEKQNPTVIIDGMERGNGAVLADFIKLLRQSVKDSLIPQVIQKVRERPSESLCHLLSQLSFHVEEMIEDLGIRIFIHYPSACVEFLSPHPKLMSIDMVLD
ncbi:hypothetical protein KSP39_PZI011755 [Platanthera zijinensis]|uniref:Uncharacterized protein n=1 Tax=Platanthera zijinensis TaxID=2320716 RepID=A0AAP0BEW6_9ASPA